MVEREIDGGLNSRAPTGPLPYGRACFRILNSRACFRILRLRACFRIQFTYWVGGLMVEHLKVLMQIAFTLSFCGNSGIVLMTQQL